MIVYSCSDSQILPTSADHDWAPGSRCSWFGGTPDSLLRCHFILDAVSFTEWSSTAFRQSSLFVWWIMEISSNISNHVQLTSEMLRLWIESSEESKLTGMNSHLRKMSPSQERNSHWERFSKSSTNFRGHRKNGTSPCHLSKTRVVILRFRDIKKKNDKNITFNHRIAQKRWKCRSHFLKHFKKLDDQKIALILEYWHSPWIQDYRAFGTAIKTGLLSRSSQIICRCGDSVQLHPAGKSSDQRLLDEYLHEFPLRYNYGYGCQEWWQAPCQ
jgi:hypothetical protein